MKSFWSDFPRFRQNSPEFPENSPEFPRIPRNFPEFTGPVGISRNHWEIWGNWGEIGEFPSKFRGNSGEILGKLGENW